MSKYDFTKLYFPNYFNMILQRLSIKLSIRKFLCIYKYAFIRSPLISKFTCRLLRLGVFEIVSSDRNAINKSMKNLSLAISITQAN